jgi:hypothetical protein
LRKEATRAVLCAAAVMVVGSIAPAGAQTAAPGVKAPSDYNVFQPPGVGGTYVDPVFGSTVKRISNALGTANADRGGGSLTWIADEYSTISPFNSDNSRIILVHQSYYGLYDGSGAYVRDLPLEISSSSEPRWSKSDNHTLFYIHGNQLKTYDTASGAVNIAHTFSEYSSISGMGESDISADGDHFVFAGDSRFVFLYRISTGAKSPVIDTTGHGFDSLYVTPDNNVTITWNASGSSRFNGIELFDGSMSFLRQLARAGGHMDVTRDTNGSEVLVWTNSDDPQPICNNGIVKIRLSDAQQTCLATFDWSLAVHISAPDAAGFVYVETYAPANPTPSSGWVPYTNELLQIKLDGSQVLRLAHHRSRPYQSNTYNWQPKISTSRDGSRVVYSSDYDLQLLNGYATDYCDAYLIVLSGSSSSPSSPSPVPSPAPVPPPVTPQAPAPAQGLGALVRFEQDSPAVEMTGSWYPNSGAFNSGGSAVLAMDQGSQAKLTFTGTSVQWLGYRDAWSGIGQVYLDGALKSTVDTYSAASQAEAVLYSITGLSNTSHTLAIVATGSRNGNSGGAWVWVDAFDVSSGSGSTVSASGVPTVTYMGATNSSQQLSVTFNAAGGYQTLNVVNILINSVLDARQACYLAYTRSSNTLAVVADSGDATQLSGKVMDGTGAIGNSQCTVSLAGSSATGSGNSLTLSLNINFSSSFTGNKVVYAAARDTAQSNSGWQTVGVRVGVVQQVTFPTPAAMAPASGNALAQVITLAYQDQTNADNLQTVWALVNSAIDGRSACYVAYHRPSNQVYLFPDSGDGTKATSMPLTGNNSVSNSQCTVSSEGATVTSNGNTLTVTLPVTFKASFAGYKAVWLAAQTLGGAQISAWQALGAWSVPAN